VAFPAVALTEQGRATTSMPEWTVGQYAGSRDALLISGSRAELKEFRTEEKSATLFRIGLLPDRGAGRRGDEHHAATGPQTDGLWIRAG